MGGSVNGWREWKQRVLFQLELLTNDTEKIRNDLQLALREIDKLKIKAGLWGAVAGAIPGAIAVLWAIMNR